jgi:DNA topoisomerase-2
VFEKIDGRTIRVTELPVGISFDSYKEFIEKHLVESAPTAPVNPKTGERGSIDHNKFFIKEYRSLTFPSRCDYTIVFPDDKVLTEMMSDPYSPKGILKKMKLLTRISTRNMYLFGTNGAIRKFDSPEQIIKHHHDSRIALYAVRKAHQLQELKEKISSLDKRQRFIQLVLDGVIDYRNRPKAETAAKLREHNLVDDVVSTTDEEDVDSSDAVLTPAMKSLLKISAWDLSEEEVKKFLSKIQELKDTYRRLEATSCEEIWLSELEELWIEMNAFLKESSLDLEDEELAKMLKPKKGKKAVLKGTLKGTTKAKKNSPETE